MLLNGGYGGPIEVWCGNFVSRHHLLSAILKIMMSSAVSTMDTCDSGGGTYDGISVFFFQKHDFGLTHFLNNPKLE